MKLYTFALVGVLGMLGVSAEAETCVWLCDRHFMAIATQERIIQEISKADVNARGKYGMTPLMWAAENSKAEIVKVLLGAGADVSMRTNDGLTALGFAARYNNAETVKVLLDAGADLNAKDDIGGTPLMLAARWGTAETVKVLLDAGTYTRIPADDVSKAWKYAQENAQLKGTDVYWMLNEARFK